MKRVLLIDPAANGRWVSGSSYNNGLVNSLSSKCELTLAAAVDYELMERNIKLMNCFFKHSNTMKRGTLRSVIRLWEYVRGYIEIFCNLKRNNYDVIHIQWLLCYPLDALFVKYMKRHTGLLVYTAHNVLPHIDGEKQYKILMKIYACMDKILVHGENIKKEFQAYYPQLSDRVFIQHHGEYFNLSTQYDSSAIDRVLSEKIRQYKYIFLFSGNIFYNKGLDMLVNIWLTYFTNQNALLIITGEQTSTYKEYDRKKNEIDQCDNIIRFEGFVDTNLFNFLANTCDVMIMPYRHASMSAVIFTAACFKKTVITTNVGALSEYLEDGTDSIICSPDEESLYNALYTVMQSRKREEMKEMGERLSEHIHDKYSWEQIAEQLFKMIY
ncbi:glycosyltransferase [Clostridiaceae bacterium]|jgi:glycosyltransferase involved in cell wall biosynthesis|nr:glycosyltransferase [Clostridiaceae bacterium]